jgi:ABC-type antimicrobial peptide transport system permease subunit
MALGARRASVVGLILIQSVELVAAGTLPGLVGAFFLKGLLDSMLYNLRGESFSLLIVAAFLLAAVAILVGLVTAVRAASVEPMAALRNE